MRLTCPCCGAAYTIEVLLADRAARDAVSAALALPASLGERLLRYIGLFRPRERALSWDRAARLMAELEAMISAAQIKRNGQCYPAPVDAWRVAIDQMLDGRERLALPLKSHGYLLEILVGLHQRANAPHAARQEVIEERAKARQGERGGRMQRAGAMVGEGADIVGRGDRPVAPTPARPSAPPADFRALAGKLMGKNQEVLDGPV